VNVNVSWVEAGYAGITTILIFNADRKGDIGTYVDDKHYVCCTQELIDKDLCGHRGEAIYNADPSLEGLWSIPAEISDLNKSSILEGYYNITKSGVYWAYIVNCHTSDESNGIVNLDGRVVFMNPYGYLNGEFFYFLPFYGTLTILYIILGIYWCIVSLKHRKQILRLQNAITAVIILGIVEAAILCFDNLGFNNIGLNYTGAMIVGVLVSTVKKTISRVLVLVVSMGYGVVKPTLGDAKLRVIILAVLYTIFSGTLNIVELVQRTTTLNIAVLLLLVFPVAALDTAFYWWIFLSLLRTIQQLQTRKQTIKLGMYRIFLGLLGVSGLLSGIITLIQIIVMSILDSDAIWKENWMWTAFWHVLYYFILFAIAVIWRPTSNNTRYAYTEMNVEGEDIVLQPPNVLTEVMTQRKTNSEELATLQNPQQQKANEKKANDLTAAFSIDDEDKDGGNSKLE